MNICLASEQYKYIYLAVDKSIFAHNIIGNFIFNFYINNDNNIGDSKNIRTLLTADVYIA